MTTDAFLFNAGWLFFAAWIAVVAAVTVTAFGRDLLANRSWRKAVGIKTVVVMATVMRKRTSRR